MTDYGLKVFLLLAYFPSAGVLKSPFLNFHAQTTSDTALAYFYFAPKIVVSEEHYFYTTLSLMAEIGGYLGLLLGVSIFHFAAWVAGLLQPRIDRIDKIEAHKNTTMTADVSPKELSSNTAF